eukprot:TRINITY_DN5350_c0_g1_i1.p1 TRINITY_DN5350_c0_g1~~TRINITY_DN5350_c0_g1_i1.p1  ORF type:complete len:360 (+),score=71.34 TRINITY_DN5350_c0_g1_i1:46-1080(+)
MKVPFYALLHEPGIALGSLGFGMCCYLNTRRMMMLGYASMSLALLSVLLAHFCLAWAVVVVAMHFRLPRIMGKRQDGSMPLSMILLWWPWMVVHFGYIHYFRLVRRPNFPVVSEIHEGFYLGGFPAFVSFDTSLYYPRPLLSRNGNTFEVVEKSPFVSVVDLTCELPQVHSYPHYLNIPTWDGTAPTLEELDHACEWIAEQRAAGRGVLVHCCYGVGRSATVLCVALVKCGVCQSCEEAEQLMMSHRPLVYLTPYHWATLRRWSDINVPKPPHPSLPAFCSPCSTPVLRCTSPDDDLPRSPTPAASPGVLSNDDEDSRAPQNPPPSAAVAPSTSAKLSTQSAQR